MGRHFAEPDPFGALQRPGCEIGAHRFVAVPVVHLTNGRNTRGSTAIRGNALNPYPMITELHLPADLLREARHEHQVGQRA